MYNSKAEFCCNNGHHVLLVSFNSCQFSTWISERAKDRDLFWFLYCNSQKPNQDLASVNVVLSEEEGEEDTDLGLCMLAAVIIAADMYVTWKM